MEVPGIEPAISWSVLRHADAYTNDITFNLVISTVIIKKTPDFITEVNTEDPHVFSDIYRIK